MNLQIKPRLYDDRILYDVLRGPGRSFELDFTAALNLDERRGENERDMNFGFSFNFPERRERDKTEMSLSNFYTFGQRSYVY